VIVAVGRRLMATLPRSRLGREIALVLLVKTLLLGGLCNAIAPGPAPRRVDAGLAEQHLLGRHAPAAAAARDPHER
jgi:hypothetical protein